MLVMATPVRVRKMTYRIIKPPADLLAIRTCTCWHQKKKKLKEEGNSRLKIQLSFTLRRSDNEREVTSQQGRIFVFKLNQLTKNKQEIDRNRKIFNLILNRIVKRNVEKLPLSPRIRNLQGDEATSQQGTTNTGSFS